MSADIKFMRAAGRRKQRSEMTARAGAYCADSVRVVSVCAGMRAQPAYSGFAVLDLRGENGVAAVAVIQAGYSVAQGQERRRVHIGPGLRQPSATVDPDDERPLGRPR